MKKAAIAGLQYNEVLSRWSLKIFEQTTSSARVSVRYQQVCPPEDNGKDNHIHTQKSQATSPLLHHSESMVNSMLRWYHWSTPPCAQSEISPREVR